MIDEEDELLQIAKLGIEAEAFVRSPLGKYLMLKANAEISAAMDDLVSADPADVKLNTEIRVHIHTAKMFIIWVNEAANIGRQAHNQLRSLEE